jgi:hypothetical protein
VRIVRDEPRIEPTWGVCGALGRTVGRLVERIVEDGIRHTHEDAFAIDHVGYPGLTRRRAGSTDTSPKLGSEGRELAYVRIRGDHVEDKILCCGVSCVVLRTPVQFGQ